MLPGESRLGETAELRRHGGKIVDDPAELVAVEDEEIARGRRPHRRRPRLIEEHRHLPEEFPLPQPAAPRRRKKFTCSA